MEETWDNISLKAAEWAKVDGFSAELTAMITKCQDLPMMNQSQQRASNYSFKRELVQLALEFLMVEIWDNTSQKVAEWEKAVGSSVELMVMTTECQDPHTMSQSQQRASNYLFKKELAQHALESQTEEIWDNTSQKAAEWEKADGSSVESTAMTIECQDLPMMNQRPQRASNYLSKKEPAQHAQVFLMEEIWDNISQKAAEWVKAVGSSAESMVMITECQGLPMMNQRPQRASNYLSKKELAQLAQVFQMEEIWVNTSQKAAEWEKADGSSAESTVTTIECQDLLMMSQNQLRANNFLPKLAQHAQESQMEETWDNISLRAAEWEKVVGSSVESMVMTTECQDHLMTSQKLQRANNESDCLQNWCFEFNNNHNKYYII